nr:MAG TPA: multi-glycosylated core protein [Caudoviricetes sp.]
MIKGLVVCVLYLYTVLVIARFCAINDRNY